MYLGSYGFTIPNDTLTPQQQKKLCKDLSFYPPKSYVGGFVGPPLRCWRTSSSKMYVPRFYGVTSFGDVESRLPTCTTIDVPFAGSIRDAQRPAIDAFMGSKHRCGLLELPCGFGKTVIALNLVSQLKVKTLIIVHKTFLMDQWVERIGEFLPTARVGRIQGGTIDLEDKDIVIGMLQSLSMKEYNHATFASFGLTIVYETHHIAADVFSGALFKIVTPHMLGLSATMERKDGRTKVFKLFLGEVLYTAVREPAGDLLVHRCAFKSSDPEFNQGSENYAVMIRMLCEFAPRSEFILTILEHLLGDARNEQIMVLSQNLSLLDYLYAALGHRFSDAATVGYYVGGMKQTALKQSETCRIVLGTYAMAEEALDIKTLTTLVLATPKTDVTQAVGRILRVKHERPLVIDVLDDHGIFCNQAAKRLAFYRKNGYQIVQSAFGQFPEADPVVKGARKRPVCMLLGEA